MTYDNLTLRHKAVLNLLIEGYTNKEIACEMGIKQHTVRNHIAAITKLMGVKNRVQAAVLYDRMKHTQQEEIVK